VEIDRSRAAAGENDACRRSRSFLRGSWLSLFRAFNFLETQGGFGRLFLCEELSA
jgi:hypothetical protein